MKKAIGTFLIILSILTLISSAIFIWFIIFVDKNKGFTLMLFIIYIVLAIGLYYGGRYLQK